ncbi:MAG: YvcK family protein [Candidatus Levybacteria bacterium]|nr:YvcK family protein [Candidatus Levybacteria bacterium]
MVNKKIVCLGGGIGTVNLVKGLIESVGDITVVASMADDGGSTGRLRRLFSIPPPGDLVSCIAAMSQADGAMKKLLTYRFEGERYGEEEALGGHKLGNLMMVALTQIMGDFGKALSQMQKIFKTRGKILPATAESVSIWATTSVGERVDREENIDLGRFTGTIEKLHLKPENPKVAKEVIDEIISADLIIAGPGDLYSTILPVLLVPGILGAIKKSKAKKLYVINVANKLFETPNYKVNDYIKAVTNHCGENIFDSVLMNNNTSSAIPDKYKRQYESVPLNYEKNKSYAVIAKDIVNSEFPLYHDSVKLARTIIDNI